MPSGRNLPTPRDKASSDAGSRALSPFSRLGEKVAREGGRMRGRAASAVGRKGGSDQPEGFLGCGGDRGVGQAQHPIAFPVEPSIPSRVPLWPQCVIVTV